MRREWMLRWSGYLAVAIAFAVVCVLLSNWQFDRNESRSTQLQLVEQNYDAAPVAFGELIDPLAPMSPGDEWRPVMLTGTYDADGQLLARNRPHGGTSAFEVLVPLRTDDRRTVIINRGWVAPGEGPLPDHIPAPPGGEVTVTARLRAGEPLPPSGRGAPPGQVPTINLSFIADVLDDASIETGTYGELMSESPTAEERPAALPAPTEDPGPHLSYAIQWILFAVMGFIFIGYVIRTEVVKHREDHEGRAVKTRRRDKDMSEEDALLDASV